MRSLQGTIQYCMRICSYQLPTPRKLSYIGPFITFFHQDFHWICQIYLYWRCLMLKQLVLVCRETHKMDPRNMEKDSTTKIWLSVMLLVSTLVPQQSPFNKEGYWNSGGSTLVSTISGNHSIISITVYTS